MIDGSLEALTKLLASLPGLGSRSAKRIALHLLTHKEDTMLPLAEAIQESAERIQPCHICGNLDVSNPCKICADPTRDKNTLCIVAGVADLWAIERTHSYKGQYHILGGILSALDGVNPQDLNIDQLVKRIETENITEVIFALSATVEGQSTVHYISDQLADFSVQITKLAHGVPIGGELDYLDDSTISTALDNRKKTGTF